MASDFGCPSHRRLFLYSHHQRAAVCSLAYRCCVAPHTVSLQPWRSNHSAPQAWCSVKPAGKGAVALQKESRWGASYPTQFKVLLDRSIRVRRFQAFSTQDFLQFAIVGAPSPQTSSTPNPSTWPVPQLSVLYSSGTLCMCCPLCAHPYTACTWVSLMRWKVDRAAIVIL